MPGIGRDQPHLDAVGGIGAGIEVLGEEDGAGAEWEAKENIDGRLANGWFVLSTGGDIKASTPLRSWVEAAPAALPQEVPMSKGQ